MFEVSEAVYQRFISRHTKEILYVNTNFMDVDQYKNTSLSQLYHPPRTPFSQNTNHWLLLPCEYCKVFKNNFFIESFQKQPFADIPQNRYSLKFRKLHRKALCWGLILKNLQVEGLPLHKKDSATGIFL